MKKKLYYQFIIVFIIISVSTSILLTKYGTLTRIEDPVKRKGLIPIGTVLQGKHFLQDATIPPFKDWGSRVNIALLGATYVRTNPGTFNVIVTQGNQVLKFNKKAAELKNNKLIHFPLPTSKFKPGPIKIEIFTEDNSSIFGVTFWAKKNQYKEPILLNGIPQEHGLFIEYFLWVPPWTHLSNRMGPVAAIALLFIFCATTTLTIVVAIQDKKTGGK